jgi:hypothetical protein
MAFPTQLGRYRLIRRIGQGGMGDVYLAELEAAAGIRRQVAVKVLAERTQGTSPPAALLAEARLGAMLSHPNIVHLLDAGVDDGIAWFAMELVSGLSLSELFKTSSGRLPPWVAARIVADAAAAVHALHQARDPAGKPLEIVHRDVSPHNLLISWDGNVKLADLGLARSALQPSATRSGVVKGKLGYMSPEQASGEAVDRRTDIFALGVVLWEALAWRRLFKGATYSETLANVVRCEIPALPAIWPDVPAPLAEIAARALERRPAQRFSTALEMRRELEAALAGSGLVIGATEVGQVLSALAPERVRQHERDQWNDRRASAALTKRARAARSNRAPYAAVAALAGGAAVAAAFVLLRPSPAPERDRAARAPAAVAPAGVPAAAPAAARLAPPVAKAAVVPVAVAPVGVPAAPAASVAAPPAAKAAAPVAVLPVAKDAAPPAAKAAVVRRAVLPVAKALGPAPVVGIEGRNAPAAPPPAAPSPPRSRLPGPARAQPDAHRTAAPAPAGELGAINVSASPTWAVIRLDGEDVGSTPTAIPGLRPGKHVVEAWPEGSGPALRRAVIVSPGRTTKVELTLPR